MVLAKLEGCLYVGLDYCIGNFCSNDWIARRVRDGYYIGVFSRLGFKAPRRDFGQPRFKVAATICYALPSGFQFRILINFDGLQRASNHTLALNDIYLCRHVSRRHHSLQDNGGDRIR
mgnify:CR=1 FL=1